MQSKCKEYTNMYDDCFKSKIIEYEQTNCRRLKKKKPTVSVSGFDPGYKTLGGDGRVWTVREKKVKNQRGTRKIWHRGEIFQKDVKLRYYCTSDQKIPELKYDKNPTQSFMVMKSSDANRYKFVYKKKKGIPGEIMGNDNQPFDFDNNPSCRLYKLQCMCYKNGTRELCPRTSYNSAGMCWQHLKTKWNLTIKQTKIEYDGKRLRMRGLFACDPKKSDSDIIFKIGDVICPYIGIVYNENELNSRYPDNKTAPYVQKIEITTNQGKCNLYIDASCLRGIGSLSNHKVDGNAIMCSAADNLIYPSHDNGIMPWLQAIKDIRNGDEICFDYGDDYEMDMKDIITFTRPKGRRVDSKGSYNNMYNQCKIKRKNVVKKLKKKTSVMYKL